MTDLAKTHELKSLRTQLTKAQGDHQAATEEVRSAQRRAATIKKEIDTISARIEELQKASVDSGSPIVSEHAILRYLQRVKGIDIEAVCREILDPSTVANMRFAAGAKTKIRREGFDLIVANNQVVTVAGGADSQLRSEERRRNVNSKRTPRHLANDEAESMS